MSLTVSLISNIWSTEFTDYQIKAKGTLMQMVAADWLRSDKREDDLGGRPGSIVQVDFLLVFWFLTLIIFSHHVA